MYVYLKILTTLVSTSDDKKQVKPGQTTNVSLSVRYSPIQLKKRSSYTYYTPLFHYEYLIYKFYNSPKPTLL